MDDIIGKAKKIHQHARRKHEHRIVGQVAALVCYKCGLRLREDWIAGSTGPFAVLAAGIGSVLSIRSYLS